MKGEAVESGGNPFGYDGYYAGTIAAITEGVTQAGKPFTSCDIKVEVSNSQYPERVFLTNKEDAPLLTPINQIMLATGQPKVVAGTQGINILDILKRLVGQKVSILMAPGGEKGYHRAVTDFNYTTVAPATQVGEKVIVKAKSAGPSAPVAPSIPSDDVPF